MMTLSRNFYLLRRRVRLLRMVARRVAAQIEPRSRVTNRSVARGVRALTALPLTDACLGAARLTEDAFVRPCSFSVGLVHYIRHHARATQVLPAAAGGSNRPVKKRFSAQPRVPSANRRPTNRGSRLLSLDVEHLRGGPALLLFETVHLV